MRLSVALFTALSCVFFGGCGSNQSAPPGHDMAMSLPDDLAMALLPSDLASSNPLPDGGSPVGDDGGIVGATCTTACDCNGGLACVNGTCTMAAVSVYCCSAATCPNGDICQESTGHYARCGGATPDLAGFDYCSLISCNGVNGPQTCTNAGCNQCVASTRGGMACAK